MRKHITILAALLITAGAAAQTGTNDTINRMVLVESTYNPIIAGAIKRNFIPEGVEPSMKKETIVYANESVPISRFTRTQRIAESTNIARSTNHPGYLHLGFGNYNNLDGLAAYSLRFKERHTLTMNAHINGWSGNIKSYNDTQWHSSLHDMGLNADYRLLLGKAELTAGINAAYYNYNYLKGARFHGDSDWQQSHRLGGKLDIKGTIKEHYQYHAAAKYTHFGRNAYFSNKQYHGQGHLHTEASFGIDLYEYGLASLFLRSDVLLHQGLDIYGDYLSIGITPKWSYQYEDLNLTAGTNLDFQGSKFGPIVQASPDCKISYIPSKIFSADLILNGGRDIHSFSYLYALSPYWASHSQLTSSYTFANICLLGNVRIIEGLHLHLGGGYRITDNALFEQAFEKNELMYTGFTTQDAKVAYANARVDYTYKDWINVIAEGNYNHWRVEGSQAILARAPQLDAHLNTRVRIIPDLYAHTDFRLVMFNTIDGFCERSIIDWSLGAHFTMNDKLSFFLDGHNLLNRHYERYTGYPNQGINGMLGAIFKF